jgi:hypothetical protein
MIVTISYLQKVNVVFELNIMSFEEVMLLDDQQDSKFKKL